MVFTLPSLTMLIFNETEVIFDHVSWSTGLSFKLCLDFGYTYFHNKFRREHTNSFLGESFAKTTFLLCMAEMMTDALVVIDLFRSSKTLNAQKRNLCEWDVLYLQDRQDLSNTEKEAAF
eukprot:Pompholyxophrys_punicea_v1_NODE_1646_length_607_cov_1.483696.p1 type:complete len:119 gc:universal NODE_1646_length_607_cov_1.483696:410-54(-)